MLIHSLARLPLDLHELHLPRWVPSTTRRIEGDPDLQAALAKAFIGSSLPSEQASFAALLSRAGALDEPVAAHMEERIGISRAATLPEIGFDLVAQTYRVVEHVLVEALL